MLEFKLLTVFMAQNRSVGFMCDNLGRVKRSFDLVQAEQSIVSCLALSCMNIIFHLVKSTSQDMSLLQISRYMTKPTKWNVHPDSDPASLIRVFAGYMTKPWVLSYP